MEKSASQCFSDAFDAAIDRIFRHTDSFDDPVLIRGGNRISMLNLRDTLNAYGPRDIVVNFNGDIKAWEKHIKEGLREDENTEHFVWAPPGTGVVDALRPLLDGLRHEIVDALRFDWLTEESEGWEVLTSLIANRVEEEAQKKYISKEGMVQVPFSEWDISAHIYGVFESLDDHDCEIWYKK